MKRLFLMLSLLVGLAGQSFAESQCQTCIDHCINKSESSHNMGGSSHDPKCLKQHCAKECIISSTTCQEYMLAYQGPVAPQFAQQLCSSIEKYFFSK